MVLYFLQNITFSNEINNSLWMFNISVTKYYISFPYITLTDCFTVLGPESTEMRGGINLSGTINEIVIKWKSRYHWQIRKNWEPQLSAGEKHKAGGQMRAGGHYLGGAESRDFKDVCMGREKRKKRLFGCISSGDLKHDWDKNWAVTWSFEFIFLWNFLQWLP